MQRILVVGSTGAGKSTLATRLAQRLELPFHEMDALHFTGPDWYVDPGFAGRTGALVRTPGWIFDSIGYPEVRDLLWEHADTVVWLDHPRRVVMFRVLRRSLGRTLRREHVFGGNRETVRGWFSREHPVWWAWARFAGRRAEIARRTADARFAPLRVVRLRTPAEAETWLRTVPGPA